MFATKQVWIMLQASVVGSCILLSVARADETPRATLETAIKAHGGKENIAKTLTGTLLAKAKMTLAADLEATISWEETFELPRRGQKGSGVEKGSGVDSG